jgi:hypothetical protein
MSKLRNIKVVKDMLEGNHRSQTRTVVGYEPKKEYVKREVGEIWDETLPDGTVIEWEQKKGYKIKRPKNLKVLSDVREFLQQYPNCYVDCKKKKRKNYTKYDDDTRKIHGMCLDCLARFETQLKVEGKFEEYEREKKLNSLIDLFKEAEKEKEIIKQSLESINFANEDGTQERWNVENKEAFLLKIDEDFEKLKNSLIEPLLPSQPEN